MGKSKDKCVICDDNLLMCNCFIPMNERNPAYVTSLALSRLANTMCSYIGAEKTNKIIQESNFSDVILQSVKRHENMNNLTGTYEV